MSKKSPPLPSSGGSYVLTGSDLKRVEDPTEELTRGEIEEAEKAAEELAQREAEEAEKAADKGKSK